MWAKESSINHQELNPEWFKEFAQLLNKKTDQKKLQEVKKVFVEAYFENIRDGMNQKEAVQKAKSIALCFLLFVQ
jgi:hypothetical protein